MIISLPAAETSSTTVSWFARPDGLITPSLVSARLVTDATVANRFPTLLIADPAGSVRWACGGGSQAASLTRQHMFRRLSTLAFAGIGSYQFQPCPDIPSLPQGWKLGIYLETGQAGDVLSDLVALVDWVPYWL